MAKAPCKSCKKSDECEECPEWIFTFADLVMLMMGFFVILWVLKPAPGKDGAPKSEELPVEVVAAIRGAFGYMPDPQSKDPVDRHMMLEKLGQMKLPQGPGQGGKTLLPPDGADGSDPEVQTIRLGKQITVGGRLLFDQGSAKLTVPTKKALDQIASEIRGHRNIVLVKGHTSADDLPDTGTAQEKMDLSLKRAQAVADQLTSLGVEPEILRVQGCSTFEPVALRAYESDSKSLNRRVEVDATSTLVEELKDSPKVAPTTAKVQTEKHSAIKHEK